MDYPQHAPLTRQGCSQGKDIMGVVRGLVAEGWTITAGQLSTLSPYVRAHISRFGSYATDELGHRPEAFNPVLKEVDLTTADLAA